MLLGRPRYEEALHVVRDAYSKHCRLLGEDDRESLVLAENYASSLGSQRRYGEAKALLRKTIPVARRVLGEDHQLTIKMRWLYAAALCENEDATLDNLREAVTTLEETERTARRVFGGAHPTTVGIGGALQDARAALRDTPGST